MLFALSIRKLGILKQTCGKAMNELNDISKTSNDAMSASSVGNFDIWLWDKLRSKNVEQYLKKLKIEKKLTRIYRL